MNARGRRIGRLMRIALGGACALVFLAAGLAALAQQRGTPQGEWRYIGGDAFHTRYLPVDQINAGNSTSRTTRPSRA